MKLTHTALALLALGVFAACEKKDDADDATPADTSAVAAPAPTTEVPEPVKIDLDEVKDSGIKGEATATHTANDVTVSILLTEGAKPEETYPAHIHTGTCDKGGPVAVELEPVKNGQSMKTIPLSSLPQGQDAFVQVHNAKGVAVACGDMKGHGEHHDNDTTKATTTTSM